MGPAHYKQLSKRAALVGALVVACTWLAPAGAQADPPVTSEFRDLYRNSAVLGMGGADVATAEGEVALWANPAGLGAKKFSINYMNAFFETSRDTGLTGLQYATGSQQINGNTINGLMGKDIYERVQIAPSIQMGNFGFGVMVDQELALQAKNEALPQIVFGSQETNGIQLAYGTSVTPGKNGKSELRIGIAGKLMYRRGGYTLEDLSTLFSLSEDELKSQLGSYQRGYGADAGLQYIYKLNSRIQFTSGLAWTDIGNTAFGTADDQPQDLSLGVAAKMAFGLSKFVLEYDLHYLATPGDLRNKSHLGLSFGVPLLSVYAGYNQISYTLGTAVDLWLFRFTASTYAEEIGYIAGEDSERRYTLQVALKVGL
jgi:hypothetical protein